MRYVYSFLFLFFFFLSSPANAQTRKLAVIGSSTSAGLAVSNPDSSWVRRISYYYKNLSAVADTVFNLGVSSTNIYHAMPTSYIPPGGRPNSNPLYNVTRAVNLIADVANPAQGVVIVNFPSGGYDSYSTAEIMTAFQIIYDSATRTGNRCYITTTQPRTAGSFSSSAVKRKLADLKDSIINRFGVANTINFWDGMFNPADTTILAAYSAGDSVHFNNAGHRVLFERVRAKNIFQLPGLAYRSNVSPTGIWNNAASWQVYNGSDWVTASFPPSSGDSSITILPDDSIRLNAFTELDQVIIQPGGTLHIFNSSGTPPSQAVATLLNGTGDDLVNQGRLYISGNGLLNGDGSVRNTLSGLFVMRNRGVLQANAVNDGTVSVVSTGIMRGITFTNNKTFVLQDLTLNLIRSTFINNDSFAIVGGGNSFIADSTLVGGEFINSLAGKISRLASTGSTAFNSSVIFRNNGIVKGVGTYAIFNSATGTLGRIAPGNSPGTLTVNPALFNSRTPVVDIEISTSGARKGIDYDHLIISNTGTTIKNISGSTLRVTDLAADPVGTVYTVLTPVSGTITGTFAAVQLSPTLSGPFYHNGDSVTVVKVIPLPLVWKYFKGRYEGTSVQLEWGTIQEINTAYFDVQHSTDGRNFQTIGKVNAAGNSSTEQSYQFRDANPAQSLNYYRIRQVDNDGRHSFSGTISLRVENNSAAVRISPNPAIDQLTFDSPHEECIVIFYDQSGKAVKEYLLKKGKSSLMVEALPRGTYYLGVMHQGRKIESHKIILRH